MSRAHNSTQRHRQHSTPKSQFQRFFLFVILLLLACEPPKQTKLKLTTSLVSSTQADHGWAVNYPKQRKLFWIHGQFWSFYSDGKDAVYRRSSDGKQWSSPLLVKKGGHYGHRTSYWFDGTFIHYAHNAAAAGEWVVYRRGKPLPNGQITWDEEQKVFEVSSRQNAMYPKVIVDTQGHPWVAFVLCKGGPHNAPYDSVVLRSSTKDGTWKTAPSFPHRLVIDNPDSYPHPLGVPLLKGKTYWIFNRAKGEQYRGKLWEGSKWSPEEKISKGTGSYGLFHLAADGDTVHTVFLTSGVRYRKRSIDKGWGDETSVYSGGSGHASLTMIAPERLIVTWLSPSDHKVLFREKNGQEWNPTEFLVDESAQGLSGSETTKGTNLNTLVKATPKHRMAATYTTGTRPPFQIRFIAIDR